MKSDAIAYGVSGILFGLIAGWIIGTHQGAPPAAPPSTPATNAEPSGGTTATVVNEDQVKAFKAMAEREPSNPSPLVQLGNLYFDAERYDDASQWYAKALKLTPNDVDVSTDLGICYYSLNQPDKALEQFARSLEINPRHTKTLLNVGIVRAFGKQDLDGAQAVWQTLVKMAPETPEGQRAKQMLEALKSHSAAPTSGQ